MSPVDNEHSDRFLAAATRTCVLTHTCKRLKGTSDDFLFSVAVASSGNFYGAGYSYSSEAPILTHGAKDALMFKFDSSATLIWGKYFGSGGDEQFLSVAVDASESGVYGGGFTQSSALTNGDKDVLLIKFSGTDGSI
jgi:hypothetical protein